MNVEVVVPVEFQGNIMGMVTRRSGLINSIEGTEHYGTVTADVSIVVKAHQAVANIVKIRKSS